MPYATFSQAKQWVESGFGECDPKKTGRAVNAIRRHFFSWYEKLALFMDATECFRLHRFCVDCNNCNDSYLGITLPRDMQAVEAIWWNDWPLRMKSSWHEYQSGISPECDCQLAKIDVAGFFPTAVDLDPSRPSKVVVRAFDPEDAGKRLVVRGIAGTGQPYSHEFTLSPDSQESSGSFRSIDQMGGVVKDVTQGQVVMSDANGQMLSIYEPDETVPGYRRIKIGGLNRTCDSLNIRASRRFFPIHTDGTAVETDNETAFDAMARYLRLYERSDKSRDSIAAEKDHYATAFSLMTGDKSREIGRGTESQISFATPMFRGRRLNRGGGVRW